MTVEAAREAGQAELARELDALRDRATWLEYSSKHFAAVQEIGAELGLPVHLWPDEWHITYGDDKVAEWLQPWKDRQSPEPFGGRELPTDEPPAIPARLQHS